MNYSLELSEHNPRKIRSGTIEHLITAGLGYCCVDFFWARYHAVPAPTVADRLGCHPDSIRRHKQKWREGQFACLETSACIKRFMEFL